MKSLKMMKQFENILKDRKLENLIGIHKKILYHLKRSYFTIKNKKNLLAKVTVSADISEQVFDSLRLEFEDVEDNGK